MRNEAFFEVMVVDNDDDDDDNNNDVVRFYVHFQVRRCQKAIERCEQPGAPGSQPEMKLCKVLQICCSQEGTVLCTFSNKSDATKFATLRSGFVEGLGIHEDRSWHLFTNECSVF